MSGFTKGKWQYGHNGYETGYHVAVDGMYLLEVDKEDDARLIAAAPELYEALKAMTDAFLDTKGSHGAQEQAAMEAAYAALAKVDA